MKKRTKMQTVGTILFLNVAPTNSQIIHAADDRNRVFRSRDSGQSWEILS
ncbi:MAG: hypothetical protein J7647_20675 [Cyanobacteria bacterium SBLK]|nr:hypothetical protein [Cyanobacteria bacterium SBLK]